MILFGLQVANGEIGKGQRIGGQIGNCSLIALNSLIVLLFVLIDVSQVVVGITIARIDLNCLLVALDSFLFIILVLMKDG